MWTEDDELELLQLLLEEEEYQKGRFIDYLFPDDNIPLEAGTFPCGHRMVSEATQIHRRADYPASLDFFEAGKNNDIRLFMAGNRLGKTTSAGYELVCHLTGEYPHWWVGKRFTGANNWYVIGKSAETTREVLQELLLGPVGVFGTGLIPKDQLDFGSLTDAKKASTGVGVVRVKHKTGIFSTISFKSFDQGRQSFEGFAGSIWIDEECPVSVYSECLLRITTGNNMLMITFTPLKGPSDTVKSFFPDGDFKATGQTNKNCWVTRASMNDAKHLSKEKVEMILASVPPFQREARRHGIPVLGAGSIFPLDPATYTVDPFEIPAYWKKGYGLDVGRNTAATWIAQNPDDGTLYVYSEYFQVEGTITQHVEAITVRGSWIKGAIDTAARGRSQTDGENLFDLYTERGLKIINADKAVEAGLYELLELFIQGRLKIFSTCKGLISEIQSYSRDETGKIIKKNDHRTDSFRYAVHTRDKILKTQLESDTPANYGYDFQDKESYSDDGWMSS